MLQDYDRGIESMSWATKLSLNDPGCTRTWPWPTNSRAAEDQADGHWNRYFDLQSKVPIPAFANYLETLAFEGLARLADAYPKGEAGRLDVQEPSPPDWPAGRGQVTSKPSNGSSICTIR